MLLEKNLKVLSSKRTKGHINIRYFFITDRIANKRRSLGRVVPSPTELPKTSVDGASPAI
jgi:hypothetical protein